MYTLYSQLTPEQQVQELKEFDEKHYLDVIEGRLCVYCGMALHNCLCSHED